MAAVVDKRRDSLSQVAYDQIKTMILQKDLTPGQFINEAQLQALLGLGRTPVREAVLALAQDKLVHIHPRKGIEISRPTLKDIHDIFEIRSLLEPLILHQCFHQVDLQWAVDMRTLLLQHQDDEAGNGMGMGLATMAVLIMSNLVISLIKNIIPDKVRIPAFIVVIASFVTVVEMLMKAYTPPLYEALGVFIPLIVVNCIILGRAEAFASKNTPLDSVLDGVGIGLGFTLSLTAVGAVREILGSGAIFGISLGTADYMPLIFVLAPGAFLVLGYLMVLFNKLAKK